MTSFQKLDAYLAQDFSDDFWADSASLYACKLIEQMTPKDWEMLGRAWRERSPQWQERCAEILDWGDLHHAVPLLLQMIEQGHQSKSDSSVRVFKRNSKVKQSLH